MARKTANASGLLSGSLWEASVLASPPAPTATNITVTTSGVFTAAFTALNTSNKTTGVWLYWNTQPTTNKIVTLQEATVDTACTVTVPAASLVMGWNYIRFPTPYQWTSTAAGRYRFKVSSVGSNDSALSSAGGLVAYMDTYDSVGTLGTTDDAWVGGLIGATTTPISVEVFGTTNVCGSGIEKTPSSVSSTGRTGSAGLYIANGGRVWSDDSASSTLQIRGYYIVGNGGILDRPANPSDFTIITKTIIDCETANGNYYFGTQDGATIDMSGAVSDTPYAEYVSGAGTSASHALMDRDTDWVVGMELVFEGAAYNQIEKKVIKAVYNPREFQLCDTPGGAESALTYSHAAGSTVGMMSRNQVIEQTNSTFGAYFYNSITTRANCNFNWARWNDMSFASGVGGFNLRPQSTVTNYDGTSDYMVFAGGNSNRNGWLSITTAPSGTDTGLLFYLSPSSNAGSGAITLGSSTGRIVNQTFNDFLVFSSVGQTMILTSAFNNTFNRCRFAGCNTGNNAAGHAIAMYNSGVNTFNNCKFNTTRRQAIYASGAVKTVFNDCEFADKGSNEVDVYCVSDTYNEIVFNNSNFASPILISNYQSMLEGSRVGFHRLNNEARNHKAYQPNVIIESTGLGLDDTTADTAFDADSLAMKNTPLSATSYSNFEFNIIQKRSSKVNYFARINKSSDFNGDCILELYLNGELTPSSTYTLSGASGAFLPTPTLEADSPITDEDLIATLRLRVRGTVGEVYLDTIYDASRRDNPIASMDLWKDGVPNPFLVSTIASSTEIAAAVWEHSTAKAIKAFILKILTKVGL